HQLLLLALAQRIENYRFKEFEMPVNQMEGPQVRLADLPLAMPFDSVKHYEDYIARLKQIPQVLNDVQEVLRAGAKDQLMPVRFLLEKVPAQCDGIVAANPFLRPTQKYPASIPPAEQQRLSAAITQAVNTLVIPAYRGYASFIKSEYAPRGRSTLSVESLPDGKARYLNDIRFRTTLSNVSPA